jgi:hypothetical protein
MTMRTNRDTKEWRHVVVAVGIALLVAIGPVGTTPGRALADPNGYAFTLIHSLGDDAPGGGTFFFDFEPGGLNNHGDMAFGADVSTGGEGVFLRHKGQTTQLGRTGGAAPGGGTFAFGFLGPVALNDRGDMAFNFLLEDFIQPPPFGVNAGAYRYSHATREVTPIVIPFVTPVPGGGTFQGVFFQPTINNRGDVVFPGIVQTEKGVQVPGEENDLGIGIFRANAKGHVSSVVIPGDAAPGPPGKTFDYAVEPWVNDAGDVSFIGHIAGDDTVVAGFPPQTFFISALGGLYVKKAATGQIRTIVHAGDPAPGGGNFRQIFHDVMNNRGDIAFNGDLTPPPGANQSIGVFVYSGGTIKAVARPGDPLPGGGTLVNASLIGANVHINNRGDVFFSAQVDVGDDSLVTGLFRWSKGTLHVIARTGTVIPGVGTIFQLLQPQLVIPPPPIIAPTSGAISNDVGQVLFQATLTNENGVLNGVLLLATPKPQHDDDDD